MVYYQLTTFLCYRHINGPRIYNHADLDLEPDPPGVEQLVVADNNTISIHVEEETAAVDIELVCMLLCLMQFMLYTVTCRPIS